MPQNRRLSRSIYSTAVAPLRCYLHHSQNLTQFPVPSKHFTREFIGNFQSNSANRQTDRQTDWPGWKHTPRHLVEVLPVANNNRETTEMILIRYRDVGQQPEVFLFTTKIHFATTTAYSMLRPIFLRYNHWNTQQKWKKYNNKYVYNVMEEKYHWKYMTKQRGKYRLFSEAVKNRMLQ